MKVACAYADLANIDVSSRQAQTNLNTLPNNTSPPIT